MPLKTFDPPAAILLDVDGTLIDTFHLYLEAYRLALEPVLGYRPPDEEFLAHPPSSEMKFLVSWIGTERAAACHAQMCQHYEALHASLCEGVYDGIREMLRGLRSAGVPLGIVTGKGSHAWEVTQSSLDLGHFEVVVTDSDVRNAKPAPDGLLLAARRLGLPPTRIAYIGDSLTDLQAGRAAGMPVGAVLWPKQAEGEKDEFLERIAEFEPAWSFERPSDLVRTFAPWC